MNRKNRRSVSPRRSALARQISGGIVRRTRAILLSLGPVVALTLVVRIALAEAYHIPSGSMEPTLLVGDWLFVNKVRFGPHIPFTNLELPGYAEPKRGDVVVFVSPPQDPAIRISPREISPTLVKRITGVAGDTLLMRNGELFVNGLAEGTSNTETTSRSRPNDEALPIFEWQHRIEVYRTRFGPPRVHSTLHNWGPVVVPPAHLFMLGDNRDNSVDSRYYGPVPLANVRGSPMFVYYSYDTEEGVDYYRALTEIRWRRIGHWVR